ncbi:hypothetical protein MHU86_20419 [Fragilaria crotonensis]|nr:hypothetical protein MHU86_20419 [Fragilaria crotonensis]
MASEHQDHHHEETNETTITVRVGIDFGGTIDGVESGYIPGALASVRANVSKASEKMSERIMAFLRAENFFEETAFERENVVFVREYVDKLTVVNEKQINFFVDDSFKVVRHLVESEYMQRIFYLSDKIDQCKLLKSKVNRAKVVFSTWKTVRKGLL